VLLIGASTRAAAFSALRAGLCPWCADLFNDADLRNHCHTIALAPGSYPEGFVQVARQAPSGPWLYTGGLENRPALVARLAGMRPLWGNGPEILALVRSPLALYRLLSGAGLLCPAVRLRAEEVPQHGRWLVKPRAGAGGAHISSFPNSVWEREPPAAQPRRPVYFQEFIEGDACSAVYVGDGRCAQFLGATRQLVGAGWLHAPPFHYCGSLGPLDLSPSLHHSLEQLGNALVQGTGLRGLFGVDFILRDDQSWPVEVNPRYTASVEVLEYAQQIPALMLHRRVFEPESGIKNQRSGVGQEASLSPAPCPLPPRDYIGKAILFAGAPIRFPTHGPWHSLVEDPLPVDELPPWADIPPAGHQIAAGRPILSVFTRASSMTACLDELRRITVDLDRYLFET
jgi:predicted ATP-grasp superfamily ATP-dependent carboligase